jgi:septin family protein
VAARRASFFSGPRANNPHDERHHSVSPFSVLSARTAEEEMEGKSQRKREFGQVVVDEKNRAPFSPPEALLFDRAMLPLLASHFFIDSALKIVNNTRR